LISGNKSTGICDTVAVPTTITIKQNIRIKNGYLIAKEDITR
jgi:hypothetical protein